MTEQLTPTAQAHLKFWFRRLGPEYSEGFVYVIQGNPGTPVKIGYADNPRVRLRQLQTANPDPLNLLFVVPGNKQTERMLHLRFQQARMVGEWFGGEHLSALLALMANLADRAVEAYDGSGLPPSIDANLELGPPRMKDALLRDGEIKNERLESSLRYDEHMRRWRERNNLPGPTEIEDERRANFERYRDLMKQARARSRA